MERGDPLSLRTHLREGWTDFGLPAWLLLLLVSVNGWLYPLLSWFHHPDEPISMAMLYKADPNYLPSIRFLSRLQFGEGTVYEEAGKGINTYPFLSITLHALFFRLLGPMGLSLADAVAFLFFALLFAAWLHLVGIPAPLCGWAAVFVAAGATDAFDRFLDLFSLRPQGLPFFFIYEWRVARPLVTEPFFLLWLFTVSVLLLYPEAMARRRLWVLLAIGFAGMLQGSLECALINTYVFPVLVVIFLIRSLRDGRHRVSMLFRGIAIFVVTTSLATLPFWIQRLYEHPDQPRRIGAVTPYSWFSAGYFPLTRLGVYLALLGGGCGLLLWLKRQRRDTSPSSHQAPVDRRLWLPLLFLVGLGGVSYGGPVVTTLLFGRVPIPADFYRRFVVCFSDAILFCVLSLLCQLGEWRGRGGGATETFLRWWKRRGSLFLFFTALLLTVLRADRLAREEGIIGYGWAFHPQIYSLPHYRKDFAKLLQELETSYPEDLVLGTFDRQLFFWWVTFRGGHSFLADPYSGTLSDDALERRCILFCHLLGMTWEEFRHWLREPTFLVTWFGACKYWVTQGFGLAPPEEYEPSLRSYLETIHPYRYFHAISSKEERRLLDRFDSLARIEEMPRLDLVILPNIPLLMHLAPPTDRFQLVYQNASFRVWRASRSYVF